MDKTAAQPRRAAPPWPLPSAARRRKARPAVLAALQAVHAAGACIRCGAGEHAERRRRPADADRLRYRGDQQHHPCRRCPSQRLRRRRTAKMAPERIRGEAPPPREHLSSPGAALAPQPKAGSRPRGRRGRSPRRGAARPAGAVRAGRSPPAAPVPATGQQRRRAAPTPPRTPSSPGRPRPDGAAAAVARKQNGQPHPLEAKA